MSKLRIGLTGCGNYGRNLIRFIEKMDEYELVSVADTDENAYIEGVRKMRQKPAYYKTHSELIKAGEIDAVIIATPNYLHAQQAIEAMRAGLDVYLEKPIACTVEDCAEVLEVQRETNAKVMVGMQLRYGEVYSKAYSLLRDGIIGKPCLLWYKEFRSPFFPGSGNWRLSPEQSGGTIVEKNVHHLDLFNWYTGSEPVSVMASGGFDIIYQKEKMLDNALMIIDYKNGARACLGLSLFSANSDNDIDFIIAGEKGVLSIGQEKITVKLNDADKTVKVFEVRQEFSDMGHGGTEYSALSAFYKTVKYDIPPLTGLKEGLLSVGVALAAQISINEQRKVNLSEVVGEVSS